MAFSFGRFVLDEQGRTLLLDGREQPLQPLVFDLLVYLVRERERVVPKDELLTKLWEGTIVTDGSLQRAISLLRSVLRDGGMGHAVQTFARRGYRFSEAVPLPTEASTRAPAPLDARVLAEAGQWQRALDAFDALADTATLSPEDW